MKNYDGVNYSWGTTTIKVLFQVAEYKGSVTYTVGGTCKGLDGLPHDGMSIIENLKDAKFEEMNIGYVFYNVIQECLEMSRRFIVVVVNKK